MMLNHQFSWAFLCLAFIPIVFSQPNEEHLLWNRQPLKITIPIGQERLIVFPTRVEVDASQANITEQQLRLLNNDGVLYLFAGEPFNTQRLFVRTLDGRKTILLDINAEPQASQSTLKVIFATDEDNELYQAQPKELYSATQLMRWATQQFFSPQRLLKHPSDIIRTEMHTTRIVRIVPNHNVMVNPQASWRQGHRYLTVLEVRNHSNTSVVLEHASLVGDWRMSLFHPAMKLTPYGENGDSTFLFLLSYRPFMDSLRGY